MKLTVYGTNQYFSWDQFKGNRQCRAVVAAPSKKRAAELFEQSMYTFKNHSCATGNEAEIKAAMAEPETVIIREIF